MMLTSLFLAYAGFLGLGLAMDRHHQQVFAVRPSAGRQRAMTVAGWALLALSPVPSVIGLGWSIGLSAWFGLLTVAATVLVLLLPYAPRAALRLGVAAPAAALVPLLAA